MASFAAGGDNSSAKPYEMTFNEDSHAAQVMSNLLELRRNGEFCDVVLNVGDVNVAVHKAVLAASSPYFNAMFRGNMSEKSQEKIDIQGVECESFKLLVDYSYTGFITINKSNVEDLLLAADLFGFTNAKQGCEKFLLTQLDQTNCLDIWQLAERYNCKSLPKGALLYICSIFHDIADEDILKLDAKQLKTIIESDELNVDSEQAVLDLVLRWANNDPEIMKRRNRLSHLLSAVKLRFITPKQLNLLSKHRFADILPQGMIEDAKFCHCECAGIAMRPSCATWLYVLGGEKSFMKEKRSIEYYDCKGMEWKETTKMVGSRIAPAVVVVKNRLYVIGGCRRGDKLNTVQCYNPDTRSWGYVAHLTKCKGDVRATVLNGKIYVAGGSCSGQPTCSYVEKYCPTENKWSSVCNMTHRRRRFALVSLNTSLYAIGGFDDYKGFLSSVERYVPATNHWSKMSSMHNSRGDFAGVALSDYIYAIGGVNELRGSMRSVERYEPRTDTWSSVSQMESCRGGLAAAVYCGKIFAMNGMNEYMSVVDTVECYDETKDTWNNVATTKTARFGASAIVYSHFICKEVR